MNHNKTLNGLVIFGCAAFLIALAGYTYLGTYTRYWADDFCYNAELVQHGFWKTQLSYFHVTTYSSNRYSLTLLSGIIQLFGIPGVRAMPGAAILLWLAGATLSVSRLSKIFKAPLDRPMALLISAAIVFFSLYMAPNRFQILYWRSGFLPYLAPLICNAFLIAIILGQVLRQQTARFIPWGVGLLAFLAGGFSEASVSLQTGFFCLALAAAWLAKKYRLEGAERAFSLIIIALAASLLAMTVQIVSPINSPRLVGYGERPDALTVVEKSLSYALDFIWFSLRGLPLPHLALAGIFLLLGMGAALHRPVANDPEQAARFIARLLVIGLAGYLLVVCSYAASAYVEKAPPALRALITGRFVMVVTIAALAWLAGSRAGALARRPAPIVPLHWAIIILLAFICLYPLRAASLMVKDDLPQFQKRAAVWDTRDEKIRRSKQNGILDIEVRQIDSYYMGGTVELLPDAGYWVNGCAAKFYGVSSIAATEDW